MRLIKLGGKYAQGEHEHAIVDGDMFHVLSQWAWKAKPNGDFNHVYAIRTSRLDDGRTRDIRMHRVVLDYSGPLDVDHINRNALDNRRENLRVVTRAENVANTLYPIVSGVCKSCGSGFDRPVKLGNNAEHCSNECRDYHASRRPEALARAMAYRLLHYTYKRGAVELQCSHCNVEFLGNKSNQKYCSDPCRHKQKVINARAVGGGLQL